jgi:hypothetical protein
MLKFSSNALGALALIAGLSVAANADTRYEPYFRTINRCVGGYLVPSGMSCIYAFAACEGSRSQASETRDIHMTMTCRINPDGTCPAAFECARDGSFTHVGEGVASSRPLVCSRGTRNVECRWSDLLQR